MRARSLLIVAVTLAACDRTPVAVPEPVVHEIHGVTMGSTYQVKFVSDVAKGPVQAMVEAELAAFDLAFSNWRTDSEIARINKQATVEPLPVSARFAAVLQLALDVAKATDGAFDPTVKPLSDLYRARKKDPSAPLDAAALDRARAAVDYRAVSLRDGKLVKARPDVTLDLDGIVAGAACDAIAARLPTLSITKFYVEVTGEVTCRGEKAPGQPWRIGVVDPTSDAEGGDQPLVALPLRDRSLCTSGDYRNSLLVDGKPMHHVFDPRTGRNPEHRVVSASVLAGSAALADALGTALLVVGETKAKELWPRLAALGAQGALLLSAGDGGKLLTTEITWPREDS
jgi:thiamine biosynthesis lipoprotein